MTYVLKISPERRSELCRLARLGRKDSLTTRKLKSKAAKLRASRPEWRRKVSITTREALARPEVHAKLVESIHKFAFTPQFAETVSEATCKKMREPAIRRRHLRGLKKALKCGVNFKGGLGQEPVPFVKLLGSILIPIGFVSEHPVRYGTKRGQGYFLDFAHLQGKVAIECDGPSHRSQAKKQYDQKRDAFLKSIGWRVIRVPHD